MQGNPNRGNAVAAAIASLLLAGCAGNGKGLDANGQPSDFPKRTNHFLGVLTLPRLCVEPHRHAAFGHHLDQRITSNRLRSFGTWEKGSRIRADIPSCITTGSSYRESFAIYYGTLSPPSTLSDHSGTDRWRDCRNSFLGQRLLYWPIGSEAKR